MNRDEGVAELLLGTVNGFLPNPADLQLNATCQIGSELQSKNIFFGGLMEYLIAVDGGGTKTQVLCTTETGEKVGEGFSGSTNLTATTPGEASFNLREGIRQATIGLPAGWHIKKMVMGLAGLDTEKEKEIADGVFAGALSDLKISEMILVNDIVIAQYSGTSNPNSVTLISGTGSNCYGRNAEGKEAKVGGMDFLLSDQGSGYAIGLAVLKTALKSFDGLIAKSLLEEMVCQRFQIASIGELKNVVYHPLLSKAEVGDLSKICVDAFEKKDAAAEKIMYEALGELVQMVETVMEKTDLVNRETDCVLVGGIAQLPFFSENLTKALQKICLKVNVVFPKQPPVYGAVRLAMEKK